MLLTVIASFWGASLKLKKKNMVLATPRLWVRLPGNACFWTEQCFYPYNESHWGPNKHWLPLYIKKLKHSSKYLLFLLYRRMLYKFEVRFPFLGELSLQEKQWNNCFHCLRTRHLPAYCIFSQPVSKNERLRKKRHLWMTVVTTRLALLEGWKHSLLSLQTENQNISPACLLPSSALPHTAMFLSPALCPRSYLTLSHTSERLKNSWDALNCTLIFHKRTCMCLFAQRKHSRTSNSPYMYYFVSDI